jgi:hypothetical protein
VTMLRAGSERNRYRISEKGEIFALLQGVQAASGAQLDFLSVSTAESRLVREDGNSL